MRPAESKNNVQSKNSTRFFYPNPSSLNTFDRLWALVEGQHRFVASPHGHSPQAKSCLIGEIIDIVTFSAVGLDKNAPQRCRL
jgi:hypothetical protein